MRQIQASEAKTYLPSLLDDVERGETIVITRHGKPVARLTPDEDGRRAEIASAMDEIRKLRLESQPTTADEILEWRDEGRR